MAAPRTALDVLLSIEKLLLQLVAAKRADAAAVAPDSDLDGKWGDPVIKAKDPRDWTGAPMQGRKFSECPPEYLDLLADRFDYFAEQAELENKVTDKGKPVAPYNRKDAARARGWAKRIRDGRHVQTAETTDDAGWASAPPDDDIPF